MPEKAEEKISVFISYTQEIAPLARKIKDKLQLLDDGNVLDVFLAAELGGKKWREAILARLRTDQVLILPYPSRAMKLDWVGYELGVFQNGRGMPVCIMNTNLSSPPDQLAEWQAVKADNEGLKAFFENLFANGTYTGGTRINPKVKTDPDYRQRLKDAVKEVGEEFAAFRVEERFYAKRLTISSPNLESATGRVPSKLRFDTAVIDGSPETLALFGVEAGASWATVKDRCSRFSSDDWLAEIEEVVAMAQNKVLARTLTPFRGGGHTYIPVVSRIESIEGKPSRLNVIFVDMSGGTGLGPELLANFETMGPRWKTLFTMLDLGRRYRWGTIDPVRTAVKHPLDPNNWAPDAMKVLADARHMQKQMMRIGMAGEDNFYGAYDEDLQKGLMAALEPWPSIEAEFEKAVAAGDRPRVLKEFDRISKVNLAFLDCTTKQISRMIAGLN